MKRFANQQLRPGPHIAVCGSDKVGNFVVTTPLLRGLKAKYPDAVVDFYGSSVTQTFEEKCPFLDAHFSLYGEHSDFLADLYRFVTARKQAAGEYDLAINCNAFSELSRVLIPALNPGYVVGDALRPDLRGRLETRANDERDALCYDPDWNAPSLVTRYNGLIQGNAITEIFCRLAYVDTDYYKTEIAMEPPPFVVPDVLLHMTASRSAKEWLPANWTAVIVWCEEQGLRVGIVGTEEAQVTGECDPQADYDCLYRHAGILDLRGKTTLPQLAGAFHRTRAAVVVDAGPMHIAAAVGCRTVCIFGNDVDGDGASPIRLWAPRGPHVRIVNTSIKCRLCAERRFRNAHCPLSGHPCMEAISPAQVITALKQALANG